MLNRSFPSIRCSLISDFAFENYERIFEESTPEDASKHVLPGVPTLLEEFYLLSTIGGPFGTVPELLFEKKGLIPALQQLLVSKH